MLFRGKLVEEVTKDDLLVLVGELERAKSVDFKAQLDLKTRDEKREFLCDVTSFANASGGHLIYGVSEENGFASDVPGMQIEEESPDSLIQRMENLVQDCIEPHIPGFSIHATLLSDNRYVLIAQVPKSWIAPHAVQQGGSMRFYSRRSSGKIRMDVSDLRNAFLLTETLAERIRTFRIERLGRILAGETPVPIWSKPTAVLHIIPLMSFESGAAVDIEDAHRKMMRLPFVEGGISGCRLNFDGVLSFMNEMLEDEGPLVSQYRQLFRAGMIEAVHARLAYNSPYAGPIISERQTENWLFGSCTHLLDLIHKLGLEAPLLIMVSFLGFVGHGIAVPNAVILARTHTIDREVLDIPEVLLQAYPSVPELPDTLKPILDTLWNSAGRSSWNGYQRRMENLNAEST